VSFSPEFTQTRETFSIGISDVIFVELVLFLLLLFGPPAAGQCVEIVYFAWKPNVGCTWHASGWFDDD